MSSYFEPDPITPTQATNIDNAATVERQGTTQSIVPRPDGAAPVAATAGAAGFNYGAWVQILAAVGTAAELVGVVIDPTSAADTWEFQIGVGAAGFEVAIYTAPFFSAGAAALAVPVAIVPARLIATAARISVRAASLAGLNVARFYILIVTTPL